MATLTDEQLLTHADRARGKVVVITGGMNGIGKETALLFGKFGAKVVVGDMNVAEEDTIKQEIQQLGGESLVCKCNVLDWDMQVSMFEAAISRWGRVDVVIPCAGVAKESPADFSGDLAVVDGHPKRPNLLTYETNLTGAMYTAHLALHYFNRNQQPGDWKALVMIGSMSSWEAIPGAPLYSASKHAVLGFVRSLHGKLSVDPDMNHIRTAVIHPWFADTGILPPPIKILLAGIPLVPLSRISFSILASAVDPDPATSGCAWVLLDDGPVLRLQPAHMKEGVYGMLNARAQRIYDTVSTLKYMRNIIRDILKLIPGGRSLLTLCSIFAAWLLSWIAV